MSITETTFFKPSDQILSDMLAQLVAAIPDAHTDEDGILAIVFTIESGQLETVYLANQLLLEDMFITTASLQALQRHGQEYGVPLKDGTFSIGTLLFSGDGATYVPVNTEVGYDPGNGLDVVYFNTTSDGTIPNPGIPTPVTIAINATAGNLNGTYEYMVTFVTASGETLPSADSNAVSPVNQEINLTAIPLGGAGTTKRRIYRAKNGTGIFRMVAEIADNTTVIYTDNITDGVVAGNNLVPSIDTAHSVTVNGIAQSAGVDGNAAIGTITVLTNAPATLNAVTNPTAFAGGTDAEDTEAYRRRLLEWVQNAQTGSPNDLKSWAEAVAGVETATVFSQTTIEANMLSANESSVETGITDWANYVNATLAQSATQALNGVDSLRLTAIANGDMGAISAASKTVVPGEYYSALASFRAGSTARVVQTAIQWRDAGDTLLSVSFGPNYLLDSNANWTQAAVTYAQAPAGAVKARMVVYVVGAVTAEIHYVDQMLLVHGLQTSWVIGGAVLSPAPGHVTVRISGPAGSAPSAQVIADVATALLAQDLADVSIHVAAFTAVPTAVTVDVTTSGTYTLADVTASVQGAISDYINSLPIGGTMYLSGIVDAVFGLAGIADVVVTTPGSNQTTPSDSKRTPGTITVT
jgi:uncharacterized phage protein gp47/JayE